MPLIYTSPNKDILIALDIDKIYVYSIHENELSDNPYARYQYMKEKKL